MLQTMGLRLLPQPSSSLNWLSAEKARLPLHTGSNPEGKPLRLLARRVRNQKYRSRSPSGFQRQVVACAHATQIALQPLVTRDLTATALAAVGAYVWVRLFDWMATKGVLEQVKFLCMLTSMSCRLCGYVRMACLLRHRP